MTSKLTRTILRTFAFALALCATTSAWAAAPTPTAVWDGDFTATQTGYTLNRNDNAISQDNSTITINQNVGVKVDFSQGVNAMTVMFRYSDLSFDAQKTLATSYCSGGDENRTGVYAAKDSGTINGIWNTANWNNPMGTLSESSGVLAFCYSKTAGTSLYYVNANGIRTQLYNKDGLKAGGDAAINGCTIGGERAKSGATLLGAATGMKITGIAIFNSVLSQDEMVSYSFPSDDPTTGFDYVATIAANTTLGDITTWTKGSGTPDANSKVYIKSENNAILTIDGLLSLNTLKVVGGSVSLANGASISSTEVIGADINIAASTEVTISDSTVWSKIICNGKLETSGNLNLSGANKIATTGELKVLAGRTKMAAGDNSNGICGTLTIEPGATFENATTDGLNYGGSPTVNVYGTLDMASTRWTLGSAALNFYAGSTIEGAGQATYGALDSNSAKTFNVLAKDGQDTVNLSATLRLRNAQTFSIAAGVTVNCTGTVGDKQNQINITGNGTFKVATGASFPASVPFNVTSPATLELAGGTIADSIKGTGNLSVVSGTYEPSFSSFTGPISVSGSGTVLTLASSQITASSAITVGTGSTLKIKVTDEVIATGFDASSKVSNSGGTVMFVDSSGTQITENVSQDGETLSPAVKVLYWDGTSWSEDDDFTGYTEASIAVSGETSVTLPASLNLQKMTLTGSSGSLTIVGNNNTLTVGDVIIPTSVTLKASSALTVTGSISGGGNLTVPNGVTFTCAEGTKWYLGSSSNPTSINSGNITVENGGEFIINGWVEIQNTYDVGYFFTGLSVADGGLLQVNSTGTIRNYDNPYFKFQIAGNIVCNGSATLYDYGKFIIESTGSFDVSATANITVEAYTIDNSGILTLGRMRKLTLGDGSLIVNVGSGKIVFAPTDAYLGETVSDMTTIIGGDGTPALTFDVSNLSSLPTGTSATTLLTTSAIVPSLTGCSSDYYVKQNTTTGAVTLQLHAAKDSEGVYYDDVADAFDAIVADHLLTVTILDGTQANYAETLAAKGLFVSGTQVAFLAAERLNVQGSVIGQYPTAQAAIDADNGDSIVAIYEASTVTPILTSLYIKPVGITLGDITINCSYAGYSYVKPESDMSDMGFAGVYNITRNIAPATFTWNPEVSEGDWSDVGNWTSEDGEVGFVPNNSAWDVVLNTDATITMGNSRTVGHLSVGAAVDIRSSDNKELTLTDADGVELTSASASITLTHQGGSGLTKVNLTSTPYTSLEGMYVKTSDPTGSATVYEVATKVASVTDSGSNVTYYDSLATAVSSASTGDSIALFANSSEAITLNNKTINFSEGSYTFSGSFTGNGTLVLPEGTLLKSADASMFAEGWTGTVWLRNYTSLTGTSQQGTKSWGSTNFEPNNYGNSNSTVRFTGVKGYLTANDDGSYTIQPALELEDDGDTPGLLLYNGWGYNANAQCYTIIRELKGSGTLAADTTLSGGVIPGLNVLLQVRKWDNFTGTLNMPNKNIVFGSTLPAQSVVEGGGHIVVQSGAVVTVPTGKTWTAANGFVVSGAIKSEAELTVTSGDASMRLSEATDGDYHVYVLVPSPAEVTTTTFDINAFTYGDLPVTLEDGDTIIVPSNCEGNQWHPSLLNAAGHPVIVRKEMNWKAGIGTMTIDSGVTVYAYGDNGTALNDSGSVISGSGTLALQDSVPVNGVASVLCTISGEGSFLLRNRNAMLTVSSPLPAGKVTTFVTGAKVISESVDAGTRYRVVYGTIFSVY